MIKLGSNFIRLSEQAIFHFKPSDIVTVAGDGTNTTITVYSKNGFTKLEVKVPEKEMSPHDVVKFYHTYGPDKLKLH